jgi:hypothetical protein
MSCKLMRLRLLFNRLAKARFSFIKPVRPYLPKTTLTENIIRFRKENYAQ